MLCSSVAAMYVAVAIVSLCLLAYSASRFDTYLSTTEESRTWSQNSEPTLTHGTNVTDGNLEFHGRLSHYFRTIKSAEYNRRPQHSFAHASNAHCNHHNSRQRKGNSLSPDGSYILRDADGEYIENVEVSSTGGFVAIVMNGILRTYAVSPEHTYEWSKVVLIKLYQYQAELHRFRNGQLEGVFKLDVDSKQALCDQFDIAQGSWRYSKLDYYNPNLFYTACPRAINSSMNHEPSYYSCEDRVADRLFQHAVFERDSGCFSRPLAESMPLMAPNLTITVIGDSLAGQVFSAGACALESVGLGSSATMKYIEAVYLRQDLPCNVLECADPVYVNATAHRRQSPCRRCNVMKQMSNFSDPQILFPWLKQIHNDTKILVINSGAWFSTASNVADSNDIYLETLILFTMALERYLKDTKIRCFWHALPPMIESTLTKESAANDWDKYAAKNEIARDVFSILLPEVTFVDTDSMFRERKKHGLKDGRPVGKELLHWCSPGPMTPPQYIFETIAHIASLDCAAASAGA